MAQSKLNIIGNYEICDPDHVIVVRDADWSKYRVDTPINTALDWRALELQSLASGNQNENGNSNGNGNGNGGETGPGGIKIIRDRTGEQYTVIQWSELNTTLDVEGFAPTRTSSGNQPSGAYKTDEKHLVTHHEDDTLRGNNLIIVPKRSADQRRLTRRQYGCIHMEGKLTPIEWKATQAEKEAAFKAWDANEEALIYIWGLKDNPTYIEHRWICGLALDYQECTISTSFILSFAGALTVVKPTGTDIWIGGYAGFTQAAGDDLERTIYRLWHFVPGSEAAGIVNIKIDDTVIVADPPTDHIMEAGIIIRAKGGPEINLDGYLNMRSNVRHINIHEPDQWV